MVEAGSPLRLPPGRFAYVAVVLWGDLVEATGDTLDECDRGRCGALGEFTDDHPLLLFVLLLAGAAVPAAVAGWWLGGLFRLPKKERESTRA